MTALPLVAALIWTVALIVDNEPFGTAGALLIGVGLLSLSTVAVVGMTVTRARWSHRLGIGTAGLGLIAALLRPIDPVWVAGLIGSSAAGAAMFLPGVTTRMRKLESAGGPPPAAVAVPLLLLAVPVALGAVPGRSEAWAILTIGLSAPLFAFAFSRVIVGGLLGVRLIWPGLALALSPLLATPAAITSAVLAFGVAATAWRPEVKASFHPPRERGTSYPIPPELVPGDILDAADIDEKGRRR